MGRIESSFVSFSDIDGNRGKIDLAKEVRCYHMHKSME